MKRAEAEFVRRVYTDGKDSNGNLLGSYRSKHKQARVNKGLQTQNKDLNFDGDLLRGTTTGEQDGKAVFGIATDRLRLIAEGQEGQTGKDIFSLSKAEKDLVFKTILAETNRLLGAR
jgi:hypothetical protein